MIFTNCCYCDAPMTVAYETGDPGYGGFAGCTCTECGKISVAQLCTFGGTAYSEEDFKILFIDMGMVGPKQPPRQQT